MCFREWGKTVPDLLGQEAGDSGRMCGLIAYLKGMYKGDWLRGKGKAPGAVVETGSRGETASGHVNKYFGNIIGAAMTGLWQAWQGQVRGRGGGY